MFSFVKVKLVNFWPMKTIAVAQKVLGTVGLQFYNVCFIMLWGI